MNRVRMTMVAATVLVGVTAAAAGARLSAWGAPQKVDEVAGNHADLNTASLDGCPIQSPDGLSLYQASNRPGGRGGLNIWVATRPSTSAPWGAPTNLGEPVNSAADDFCPTPVGKNGLFFVSREPLPRRLRAGRHLLHPPHGSSGLGGARPAPLLPRRAQERARRAGPSWIDPSGRLRGQKQLYFSRSSASPVVAGEIYMSTRANGARFGPAAPVTALNDAAANDIQPNVRADGLEVVFSSNRTGSQAQDIWVSSRARATDEWSAPTNLGAPVNTAAAETRPSLSKDGSQLLFGRAPGPEGMSDIYLSSR